MEEETSEDGKVDGSEGNGKRSLIYRVGRKIVITGAVISSAPFVLPPLVVASTIGFAFAVPFGLVFAGYACTNKVMSTLLSRPPPPVEVIEEDDDGLEGEEEEFEEDLKKRLEMRLELIEDNDGMVEGNGGYVNIGEDEKLVGDGEEGWWNRGIYVEYIKENEFGGPNIVIDSDEIGEGLDGIVEEKGEYNDKEEEKLVDGEGYLVEELVGGTDVQQKDRLVREVNEFMGDESVEEREIPVVESFDGVKEEEEPANWIEAVEEGYRGGENVDMVGEENQVKREIISDSIEPVKEDEVVEEVKRLEEEISDNVEAGKKLERTDEGEASFIDYVMSKSVGNEEVPTEVTAESVEEKRDDVNVIGNVVPTEPVKEDEVVEEVKRLEEEISDNVEAEKKLERTDEGEASFSDYVMRKSVGNEEVPTEVTVESVEEKRNDVNVIGNEVPTELIQGKRDEVDAEIPIQEKAPLGGVIEGGENGYMENKVFRDKLEQNTVEGIGEGRLDRKNLDEIVTEDEEQPLVIEVKEVVEDRRIVEIDETPVVEVKVVKVISIKENAREIADESGIDLFDEQTTTPAHYDSENDEGEVSVITESHSIYQPIEVDFDPQPVILDAVSAIKKPASDLMGEESVDSSVHPDSAGGVEVVTGPNNLVSAVEINIPPKEVLYTEEKLWELMGAMRKIVGYEGVKQSNISEELKALYIFTGVEPPVGFKDPLDIIEVNDRLRLLMAIIGVK